MQCRRLFKRMRSNLGSMQCRRLFKRMRSNLFFFLGRKVLLHLIYFQDLDFVSDFGEFPLIIMMMQERPKRAVA